MTAARSAASTIAVTEPLPLVPRCGPIERPFGVAQTLDERPRCVEAELDPELFQREKVGQGSIKMADG